MKLKNISRRNTTLSINKIFSMKLQNENSNRKLREYKHVVSVLT